MTVKFVDEVPPQVKTHKGRNQRIIDQLNQKPGEWAIVYRVASRSLASSRASTLRKFGAEVTSRTEGNKILLYARVTGKAKAASKSKKLRAKKQTMTIPLPT